MHLLNVLRSRRWRHGDGLCERLIGLLGLVGFRGLSPIFVVDMRVARVGAFRCRALWRALVILAAVVHFRTDLAIAQDRPRNVLSDRYEVNQTFDRQVYDKDNNIWIYSQRFADVFGMPAEHVADLRGIEAAAFRLEDKGYEACGFGGKAENCKIEKRCITDIYVDERKHPLPWATADKSGWFADYNSLNWLRTSDEKGRFPKGPKEVVPHVPLSRAATLHPFADPETNREAVYRHNGNTPVLGDEGYGNAAMVYGYQRDAIASLTLVSFLYRCFPSNSQKKEVGFRLETITEKAGLPPSRKRFHEFVLPESFQRRIDVRLQTFREREEAFYKSLLNFK